MHFHDKLDNYSDGELVKKTLQNQDNFIYIIKRYEKRLLSYIFRISNFSFEEAEDILQEVFLKVYKNLNSYDFKMKFSSWIYRITHNEVISSFRKNKKRMRDISLDLDDTLINKLTVSLDMQKDIDNETLKNAINNLLKNLEMKYREVLMLKFIEEKSYDEISDIIKKPVGTVGTLINRAKKKLLEQIKKNNIKI